MSASSSPPTAISKRRCATANSVRIYFTASTSFPLRLPPLRERREDIPALIEHFAQQVSATNGWKPMPFTADAMTALQEHPWPGNVRELRNAVERLMLLATSDEVTAETVAQALPASAAMPDSAPPASGPLADRVRAFEKQTILAELKRNHHQISNTARALGLERSHLYKKAEQVGIDLKAVKSDRGVLRAKSRH